MGRALVTAMLGVTALLAVLLVASIAAPWLRTWPLPDRSGVAWRARRIASHASGVGIAAISVATLVLAVAERDTLVLAVPGSRVLGAGVAVLGAAFGLWGYLALGVRRSHGEPGSLERDGPYRYSRNPQYVGAAALLLGLATAFASGPALLAAAACSSWFLLAPLAEESWLREQLGHRFSAYHASAPRYLGRPSRRPRAP